jgi:peptidoglycan/LPS O-acetylase OafA/YrhL
MTVRELSRVINTAADPATPAAPAIDRRALAVVLVTGVVAFASVQLLTPTPHHPEAEPGLLALTVETVLWGSMFAAAFGFVQQRSRLGFAALAVTAWTLLAGVIACPATGHHMLGLWWGAQMALTLAFVATASVAAASHLRREVTT